MNFTNDVAQVAHNGEESFRNFDDDVNERFGTVNACKGSRSAKDGASAHREKCLIFSFRRETMKLF